MSISVMQGRLGGGGGGERAAAGTGNEGRKGQEEYLNERTRYAIYQTLILIEVILPLSFL